MKNKIIENNGKLARVCLLTADGQDGPQLDLCLVVGTKGKDGPFNYWNLAYGDTPGTPDHQDLVDWIKHLADAGAIKCGVEEWIANAISYRLNNGPFKSVQKVSKDGAKVDSLTDDQKLQNVLDALSGEEAFKIRTPGQSASTLKTKLATEQDKGKRMAEIYAERRAVEAKAKSAKGKDLDKLTAQIAKLDTEFDTLNA